MCLLGQLFIYHFMRIIKTAGLPRWLSGKDPPADAGDMDSTPGLRRFPGGGNGNPVQYPCLGNLKRSLADYSLHGVVKWLDTTQKLNHNNN